MGIPMISVLVLIFSMKELFHLCSSWGPSEYSHLCFNKKKITVECCTSWYYMKQQIKYDFKSHGVDKLLFLSLCEFYENYDSLTYISFSLSTTYKKMICRSMRSVQKQVITSSLDAWKLRLSFELVKIPVCVTQRPKRISTCKKH